MDYSPTVANGFVYADSNGDLVALGAVVTQTLRYTKGVSTSLDRVRPPTPANLKTAPAS